ncbi:unnamed protein product [Phytomonas sp. EM1]|nr:unnamed protein product [Phytomonas sp. EM1]|eukprot:CCW62369.1 unnamed protein product [Phytomonas sp. isolate EM1]
MFDGLGLESEERDMQRHRLGRRHIPHGGAQRSDVLLQYEAPNTTDSAKVNSKPQDSTSSAVLAAAPPVQGVHKPKDSLNLFSWEPHSDVPKFRSGKGRATATEEVSLKTMHDRGPILRETDEQIRNKESQKFSMCTGGRFLGFESDKPCPPRRHPIDQPIQNAPRYGVSNTQNNNDKIVRERGGKKPYQQSGDFGGPNPSDEVDGFPGLSPQRTKRTGRRVF